MPTDAICGPMVRNREHPYHHGRLKDAALHAAVETVRHDGAEALSIRRLADGLGVAHRAIYNHYADRAALLRAVASRGFTELAELAKASRNQHEFIVAYCRFALANPGLYDLMMGTPNSAFRAEPDLMRAVDALLRAVGGLWDKAAGEEATTRDRVTRVWMLLHGGVALHRSGVLGTTDDEAIAARLAAMVS